MIMDMIKHIVGNIGMAFLWSFYGLMGSQFRLHLDENEKTHNILCDLILGPIGIIIYCIRLMIKENQKPKLHKTRKEAQKPVNKYEKRAFLKVKEVSLKYEYKGVDKNGIELANVSANYLNVAHKKNRVITNDKVRRDENYFIYTAASIVEKVLDCNEKSEDGFYYYCEKAKTPIPEKYFKGYDGVQLVDIRLLNEQDGYYDPEYMYCYTFTKMENS